MLVLKVPFNLVLEGLIANPAELYQVPKLDKHLEFGCLQNGTDQFCTSTCRSELRKLRQVEFYLKQQIGYLSHKV